MLCRARAGTRASDTRLMAGAMTVHNEKIKTAALKLAHLGVILPDEMDEIFANELAGCHAVA